MRLVDWPMAGRRGFFCYGNRTKASTLTAVRGTSFLERKLAGAFRRENPTGNKDLLRHDEC